jgi:hypothetical protein
MPRLSTTTGPNGRATRLAGAAVLVLCIPCLSFAEAAPPHPIRVSAAYGVGAGSIGYAGSLSLSFQTGHDLFTVHAAGTGVPFVNVGLGDIGLLYGRSTTGRYTNASVAAGLGYTTGRVYGRDVRAIGIPVEANVTLLPCAWVGLGIGAFGNLNLTLPYCGGVLFVKVGKLR